MQRQSKTKGLIREREHRNEDPGRVEILNRLTKLALLPAKDIPTLFDEIKKDAEIKYPNDEKVRAFFAYVEEEWISDPEKFSVYGYEERTNNKMESYHCHLHDELGTTPPSEKLLRKLIIFISTS